MQQYITNPILIKKSIHRITIVKIHVVLKPEVGTGLDVSFWFTISFLTVGTAFSSICVNCVWKTLFVVIVKRISVDKGMLVLKLDISDVMVVVIESVDFGSTTSDETKDVTVSAFDDSFNELAGILER